MPIRWQEQKLREKDKLCEKSLRMIILESTSNVIVMSQKKSLEVDIVIWQEKCLPTKISPKSSKSALLYQELTYQWNNVDREVLFIEVSSLL